MPLSDRLLNDLRYLRGPDYTTLLGISAAEEIENLRAALDRIAGLAFSSADEPLDEAVDIARKARGMTPLHLAPAPLGDGWFRSSAEHPVEIWPGGPLVTFWDGFGNPMERVFRVVEGRLTLGGTGDGAEPNGYIGLRADAPPPPDMPF